MFRSVPVLLVLVPAKIKDINMYSVIFKDEMNNSLQSFKITSRRPKLCISSCGPQLIWQGSEQTSLNSTYCCLPLSTPSS